MKIACLQTFPIDYCIEYVNAIAPLGEVTLIAAEQRMRDHVDFVDPAVETVLLPWPRLRSPANLTLMYKIRQAIRARDIDIVHFLGDAVTWLTVMPLLVGRRPVVVTLHDITFHPGDVESFKIPLAVQDVFHRMATRFAVHGESVRQQFVARSGRPISDVGIVPHPALDRYVEVARRQNLPARAEHSRFRLLFFGRVMAYKGLAHLLDALDILNADGPAFELTVAGDGPGYDGLEQRLDSPAIKLHRGFVPEAEAARMFQETDLVVLPYIEATQSGILAMATAFGRAVVATDVGDLGETVRTGDIGLVVPPKDGRALADAIRRIQQDAPLKATFEAASAEAAKTGIMSPGEVAKAAEANYRKALSRNRSVTQTGRLQEGR